MRFAKIISLALAVNILAPSIARAKDFNTPESLINNGGSMQSHTVVEKKDPEPIRSRLIAVLDNKSNVADATWSKGFVTDSSPSSASPGLTKGQSRVNYVLTNVATIGLDGEQQKRIQEACEKIKSGKAKDQDFVIVHLANVLIQLKQDNGVLPNDDRYDKAKAAVIAEPKKKKQEEPAHVSEEEAKRKQVAILQDAVNTKIWSKFDAQRNTVLSALEGQSPETILQLLEGFGYMEKLFQISGGNFELFKKILLKIDEKMLSPKNPSEFNFSDFVYSLDFLRNYVLSGLRRGGTSFVSVGTGGTAGINAIDYNDLEKKINAFLDKLDLKAEMNPAIARYLITGVFDSLVGEDSLKKGTTFKLGSDGWRDVAKELRSIGAEIRAQNLWNLYLGNTETNLQTAYQRIADRLLKAVKPVDSHGKLDEAVARNMLAYVLGTGVGADSLIEVSFKDEKPIVSINQKRWKEVQQQVHYINVAVANLTLDATAQANLTNLLSKVPPESLFELSALFTMFTYRPGMANSAPTVIDILTRISNFDPSLVGDWAHALIILGARASDPDVKTVMDFVLTNLSSLIGTGAVPFSYEKRYLLYSIANRLVNFTQNMVNPLGSRGLMNLMSVENIPSQDVETLDATVDHTGMERALRNGLMSLPQARLMYLNTLTIMGKFQSIIATDTSMATPVGIVVPGKFILTLTPDRLKEVMQNELQFNMPLPAIPDAALYTRYELNALISGILSAFMVGVPALGVPGRLGQVGLGFRADITPKAGQADVYERDFKVTWPDGTETQVTATRISPGSYVFSAKYGNNTFENVTLTKNKKTGQWEVSGIQQNGVSPTATSLGPGRLRKKTDTTTSYGGGGIFEVIGENGSFIAAGGAAYKTAEEDVMLAQAGIAGANLRFADGFGLISGKINYQYQEFADMSQHDLIGDTRLAIFSQMAKQRHADILVLGEYHGTKPSTEGAVENNQGRIKFYIFGADGSVLKAGYINYADVKDKQLLEQLLGAMGDWNAISTMGGVVWKEGGKNAQGEKPDAYESYVGFDVSGWGLKETFSKKGVDVSGAGIWREIERGFNGAVQKYRQSVTSEWAAAGSVNFLKNWAVGVIYSTYEAELPTEAGVASAKKGYWRILGAYHDDNRVWTRGYVGFESTADKFNMFALAEMFARDLGSLKEMYARLSGGAPNYQAVLDGGNTAADVYTRISGWVDAEFQGYSKEVKVFIKASYFRAVLEQAKENIIGQAPLNPDELSNLNASMNIFYLYALLKVNGYSGTLLAADQRFARITSFMQTVNDPRIDDTSKATQMQNLRDSFKDDFLGSSLWQLVVGKDGKWQVASTADVLEKRGEGTFLYLRDDGWAIGGTVTYQQIQRPYYKKVESEVPVSDATTGEALLNPDGTPLMEKQVLEEEAATKDEAMWTVTGITGVRGSWRLEVTYGQREHYGVDAATTEDPKKLHALMLKALVSLPNDVFLSIAGGMISQGGAAFFTEKPLEAQGEVIVHCTVNGIPFFLGLNVSHGQYNVIEIDENDLQKMLQKGATLYKIPFGITFDTNSALGKMTVVVEPTFSDRGFEGGQIGLVTSKSGLEAGVYGGYKLTNAPNPDLRNPATTKTHLQSQIENNELLFRVLMIRAFVSVYHYSPE